ncbi:MAG: allantoate amidohydrolase [Brevibacterium yomogidense]|uniref:allantoate amidohydrolase n=1 Tax=Brevibacterium sp. Mu109 TaxID=1255669 RepID=UPI000C35B157|nr:allantoate amidohydrolase [Brevibacterium sp. Mu109]SMX83655.1 N-carbamoyl-L-amino-acid hydrolase [Brevibacterium sp. Mu109]
MTDVVSLLAQITDTGRDPRGPGYLRPGFSRVEHDLREWFVAEAESRGLDVEVDHNGITWAWATPPGENAVVTGSHLDSVPGGGEFDGPLGVASALAAIDELRESGRLARAGRPLAIAVFPEEEGSRFGISCLGSRLLTGAVGPKRALAMTDDRGDTFAEVLTRHGLDPQRVGRDHERLRRIGSFLELHVEQGVGLINTDQPVAVGSSILGHGRWHIRFEGQGNHAGTTPMARRADPVVAAARIIGDIPTIVSRFDGAVATVGRTRVHPGGTNAIASAMDVWLDIRHPDDEVVQDVLEEIAARARDRASGAGYRGQEVSLTVDQESYSPTTHFHADFTRRLSALLPEAPLQSTGAGHDAGILAAHVPSAMLFVRNPTGVSHAAEEACEDDDARAGVRALADALAMELGVEEPGVEEPAPEAKGVEGRS